MVFLAELYKFLKIVKINICNLKKGIIFVPNCPGGGIGRRAGLKHQFLPWSAGSTPAPGTALHLEGFFI